MEYDLIIMLLILILPIASQIYISYSYNTYKVIKIKNNLSGFEIARKILDANGLDNIHIVEVKGRLSDHYDLRRKALRLSTEVFHQSTIASAAIAAHEVGHAIQDKENYKLLKIRSIIFPVINIASYVAYIFLILSMALQIMNLFWLSIGLMIFSLIFQLLTLPIEFNASKRAIDQLKKLNLITENEEPGTEKVLQSAALTYVASLAASLLQIIRLIFIFQSDN